MFWNPDVYVVLLQCVLQKYDTMENEVRYHIIEYFDICHLE